MRKKMLSKRRIKASAEQGKPVERFYLFKYGLGAWRAWYVFSNRAYTATIYEHLRYVGDN